MMMVSWGRLDVQESACFTNVFELLNPEALHVVRGEACHVRRFFLVFARAKHKPVKPRL